MENISRILRIIASPIFDQLNYVTFKVHIYYLVCFVCFCIVQFIHGQTENYPAIRVHYGPLSMLIVFLFNHGGFHSKASHFTAARRNSFLLTRSQPFRCQANLSLLYLSVHNTLDWVYFNNQMPIQDLGVSQTFILTST